MPRKTRPVSTVRVRNAMPYAQAVYLETEAAVVAEPGQELVVPVHVLERLKGSGWEVVELETVVDNTEE